MIIIIDNYDSFVYNLFQYISALGYETIVYRNNAITIDQIGNFKPEAIILSPGPGHPANQKDFGVCKDILSAKDADTKILGVCLGHQGIIQHFGGRVERVKPMHGKTSMIEHNKKELFAGLDNPLSVMRYHSLAGVEIPDCLEVTAKSLDDGCVMAVQHKTLPIYGVQFHPESIMTKDGMTIIRNFLDVLEISFPVQMWSSRRPLDVRKFHEFTDSCDRIAGHLDVRKFHEFTDSCDRIAGHLDVRKFHEFKPQRFERINTKQIVSTTSMSLIEAKAAAENIFDETMTPVQIAALLTSLKMRGESIDEICAFAQVLREKSIRIAPRVDALVDTCGTGGDSSNTFNISTAAAIIASSAGAAVAKHGNRSVSSKSGSADVFEKLGAKLLQPQEVKQCIEKTSFGFMFAPYFNPIMKQVAGVRKELGFRTIFNIVGPLTNPASANFQLLGVFDPGMVEKTAECLLKLDSKHAMVVHSEGLDEIGLGTTNIAEVKNGIVESYEIDASDFGFRKKEIPLVQTSEESAKIINRVLVGAEDSAARDICLLNAAAALYISGKATGLEEGISKAANAIDSGKAKAKLEDIIEFGARY